MLKYCKKYAAIIHQTYRHGDATENSYYDKLASFITEIAEEEFNKEITVTINPKKVFHKKEKIGLPDFVIKTKDEQIIGYIEGKEPNVELSSILETDQMHRYKKLPNLILTDFCEFYFFRDGQLQRHSILFDSNSLKGMSPPKLININDFTELLKEFFSFSIKQSKTAEDLAKELGERAQILKHVLIEELESNNKSIVQVFNVFSENLIKNLSADRFANLYAQTITYGLFFAAMRDPKNELSRINAYTFIPNTIPILNKLFYYLTGANLPSSIEFIVDDIIQVLKRTLMSEIIKQFRTKQWTSDPIIHFYETFLKEFDPETRNRRGVYYTPIPVVAYIMNSIDYILKKTFGKNEGLAEFGVKVLDPAAGSMTFIDYAIKKCYDEYKIRGKTGIFSQAVHNHIIEDFYAFEILVAAYTIGHFKIFNTLENFGVESYERIKLFLTNTLEIENVPELDILPDISEENRLANEIKKNTSLLVVCGNPPYESSSMNKGKFILELMEDYKKDVKTEKNLQPLDNDYIKFIRYAQWKISQNGTGIVGMITSNSYLDGVIHRGMRKTLLKDFDSIYILNLHGSVRRSEKPPDGQSDENVFDIQQGVSISFFIKSNNKNDNASVFYYDLWGKREEKYEFLSKNIVPTTKWKSLSPKAPHYFFSPITERDEYKKFVSVTQIFDESSTGVKTHRDNFIVCPTKKILVQRLDKFIKLDGYSNEELLGEFNLKETNDWGIAGARERLSNENIIDDRIKEYHYRPYDFRWTYHSPIVMNRSRGELISNVSSSNMALVTTRQVTDPPFEHVFITDKLSDICLLSTRTKESAYIFPLNKITNGIEISNISKNLVDFLKTYFKKDVKPKDVFFYVYSVLYSKEYRKKYASSLLRDFPKIPVTSDKELFYEMVKYGEQLTDLHLLKNKQTKIVSEYPISGTNEVGKNAFKHNERKVFINDTQYFSNITQDVWEFKIGDYRVLEKWLNGKKNKILSPTDVDIFQQIVAMIYSTIIIQQKIDKLFSLLVTDLQTIEIDANQKINDF